MLAGNGMHFNFAQFRTDLWGKKIIFPSRLKIALVCVADLPLQKLYNSKAKVFILTAEII